MTTLGIIGIGVVGIGLLVAVLGGWLARRRWIRAARIESVRR